MKLILYIFFCAPMVSLGQITFYNSYGGAGNDYGKSIVLTTDTGYAIVGASESFGNGNTDMYLFKIDSLGNLKWSNVFGGPNVDWGMDLKQTADTGFILCGYSNSYSWGYDMFVVKTDKNGNSLWTKTFGGDDWDFGYSVINTVDSGYVIAGETYSYGNGFSDGYIVKLNKFGDTLWTKTFGGAGKDVFQDVIETSDGNLLFAGGTSTLDGDTDYWLVKTDNMGNEIWQYSDGDSLNEMVNSVVEVHDSNYFFVAEKESIIGTNLSMEFHKISKNGQYLISNDFDVPEDDIGKYILQYKNETDIILGGSTGYSLGNGGIDILSFKISQFATGLVYATDGTIFDDITENADTTADKGVVIVGTTDGTVNGIKSVFVIKEDSLLNAPPVLNEVLDVTSINEIKNNKTGTVFPNPASSEITIEGITNLSKQPYRIYNLVGELIQYGEMNGSIDVKNLKTGMYYVFLPSFTNKSLKFTKI